MNLLYIVGEPGVGKSTLMTELVKGRKRRVYKEPFAHTVYSDGLIQLGRERASGFGGTDALSMSVQPVVVEWLSWHKPGPARIVGEGDRLANGKFFQAAKDLGYSLDVVLLEAPRFVLTKRRQARGSSQDGKWLQGRATKVKNLRPWVTRVIDATLPVGQIADRLRYHPVFGGPDPTKPPPGCTCDYNCQSCGMLDYHQDGCPQFSICDHAREPAVNCPVHGTEVGI